MTTSQGNCDRFAAQPLSGGGTSVSTWLFADRLPALDLSGCTRLIVVAAHPDDETLGLGATAAQLAETGVEVQVVSVSDGGAGGGDVSTFDRFRLEATRRAELLSATKSLGIPPALSLGLPDGRLAGDEQRITDLLVELLDDAQAGTWCAANWRGDGHPDHEAVGRAAATATSATGITLLEYPLWMWHWAVPNDSAVPWQHAFSVPLSRSAVGRKSHAVQCFRSQIQPPVPGTPPVVPPFVLRRLLAVGEVVFV